VIAEILKKSKADLHENETVLSNTEILNQITNNRMYNTLYLEVGSTVDAQQIKKFKDIYKDFCLTQAPSNDPKQLVTNFKEVLTQEIENILTLKEKTSQYPFLSQLNDGLGFLRELKKKNRSYFFENISEYEDQLLDFREQVYDPIKQFMSGTSLKIYEAINAFVSSDKANLRYIDADKISQLRELHESNTIYKGNALKDAKSLLDDCKQELKQKLAELRDRCKQAVEEKKANLQAYDLYKTAPQKVQEEQIKEIDKALVEIESTTSIDTMKAISNDAVNELPHRIQKALQKATGKGSTVVDYENIRSISVGIGKPYLESDEDVDTYTKKLNQSLKVLIKNKKHISI